MKIRLFCAAAAWIGLICETSLGVTTIFFDPSQRATLTSSNAITDTVTSRGYRFTYTIDKWWSASPGGTPTGRFTSVNWPSGVQAQAVTVAPPGGSTSGAKITIKRTDGQPFALESFQAKLLANTAGAGASFEVMPQLAGEDAFKDPIPFDATGYGGRVFSYSTALAGYDTYIISLYVDFALVGLTLSDPSVTVPANLSISQTSSNALCLSWPAEAQGYFLQSAPDLDSGFFVDTGAVSQSLGASNVVVWPLTNGQAFFRLVQ